MSWLNYIDNEVGKTVSKMILCNKSDLEWAIDEK